jgi:acetyl-CoA carboxylase carboxyl transferase subunit beta
MSWLTNVVRPKLRELVGGGREVPDNLWKQCPNCKQMVFHRELEKNLRVCPHCDHHMRLAVADRLAMLFDEGAYQPVELPKRTADRLKFRDLRKYSDRLKDARTKTGARDALVAASGEIGGHRTVIAAMNFEFMGGSMGVSVGEGLLVAARRALEERATFIVIPASGGARMQEGILSLMQMARTTIAVEEVREAGLPYIVVLTDPTTGGVSASFAMLGDIAIAEPGSVIGFAGARVIEQTIRESLPEGFQKAEYLLEHGMIDAVVHRHQLRDTLIRIIGLLRDTRPSEPAPAGRPVEAGDSEQPSAELTEPERERHATESPPAE